MGSSIKILSTVVFYGLFSGLNLYAQKVDIDKKYITVSMASMPDNYIDEAQRTYSFNVYGNDELIQSTFEEDFKLYGWKKTNDNPTLEISTRVGTLNLGTVRSSDRTEEKKDKDGKVVSRTKYYKVIRPCSYDGSIIVKGIKNSFSEMKKAAEKEEKEAERKRKEEEKARKKGKLSKEEKKEKELAANPFLKNVDIENIDEVEEELESEEKDGLKTVYKINLDWNYDYTTSEYKDLRSAYSELDRSWNEHLAKSRENVKNTLPKHLSKTINSLYGYSPISEPLLFKRLDSEKHPEFNSYDNAIKALEVILKKMRYNKPVDPIAQDLAPIIEYFDGVVKKYGRDDDKHAKRLANASRHNLAQIYFCLDNYENAAVYANQIIQSGKDEKSGKKMLVKFEKNKEILAFQHLSSRHLVRPDSDVSEEEDE